jgi:hypothetical protein
MNIEKSIHTIQLDSAECYDIGLYIYHDLKASIQSHWKNHPDSNWQEACKIDLSRLKTFLTLGNYENLYEHYLHELTTLHKELTKKD